MKTVPLTDLYVTSHFCPPAAVLWPRKDSCRYYGRKTTAGIIPAAHKGPSAGSVYLQGGGCYLRILLKDITITDGYHFFRLLLLRKSSLMGAIALSSSNMAFIALALRAARAQLTASASAEYCTLVPSPSCT